MTRKLLLSMALLALVTGCATQPSGESADAAATDRTQRRQAESTQDIQELLAAASRAPDERAAELTIRAAEIALKEGDAEQAERILELVTGVRGGDNAKHLLYVRSRLALARGDPARALAILDDSQLLASSLTQNDQVELGLIRSEAYRAGRSYLASARERIFINNLLPEEEKAANHEKIFSALMELPAASLSNQAERAITSDLRGWLSLSAMAKQYEDDPLQQLVELNRWKKIWAHHPAASRLPASLELLSQIVKEQPKVIALLLPLRGDLGPYGRAIRDGLLAAHYSLGRDVRISIYDTSTGSVIDLVNRAMSDGAELIIGPLDREKVTSLSQARTLPVPVLALNRTLDGTGNPDMYQFGLAPEDEVIQVAEQVYREGLKNALVLYSNDEWGTRNFSTFETQWRELGGNIIDAAPYENQRDYSDLIKRLLNVDESEQRGNELRRIIGQRFEFTPRRRQDVDFVFLLANQVQARRINPTLAFYYAEDLPVYATSHVHQYTDSRIEAIDLNGIRFCDIPWKLTNTNRLQREVVATWESAKSALAPFYALGVDAYRLYPRLQQLKEIDGTRLFGTTGVLRLDDKNVVTRQLMWAQFREGETTTVPLIVETSD